MNYKGRRSFGVDPVIDLISSLLNFVTGFVVPEYSTYVSAKHIHKVKTDQPDSHFMSRVKPRNIHRIADFSEAALSASYAIKLTNHQPGCLLLLLTPLHTSRVQQTLCRVNFMQINLEGNRQFNVFQEFYTRL